jgi:lysophospholipase L1-like esterase
MKRFLQVLVFVIAVALTLPLSAAAGDKKVYVLALGDSATAGTQPIAPAPPDQPGGAPETEINRSGEGYADQLVAHLQQEGRKVKLVNLACYYEQTATMITGGSLCPYPHGSQLAEAEDFLKSHADDVLAIVMSIGANDMLRNCAFLVDPVCYQQQLATAGANLATILQRLRAVGGDVPIAMITYWDPFLALYLVPGYGLPVAQATVSEIVLPLRSMIQSTGAAYDVIVVDTLVTFQTENFTDTAVLPGVGAVPINIWNMCVYSWMCTYNDIHLTATGYGLVASAVEQALLPLTALAASRS